MVQTARIVDIVNFLILCGALTMGGCGDGRRRSKGAPAAEIVPAAPAAPAAAVPARFVVFDSTATNLVGGDTNGASDVFMHDRETGDTTRVSVDSVGTEGNGGSFDPSVSADGRFVAFESFASNLIAGDTNVVSDVFVHDRQAAITTRVNVDSAGTQGNAGGFNPAISADGRFVAFDSFATNLAAGDTNGLGDVFVHDRQTGITTRVSFDSFGVQGNGSSIRPSISSDGRFVAFDSPATNLVGGDTNASADIFLHDRLTGITTRVSVASDGTEGDDSSIQASISADGLFVAFRSGSVTLVAGDTNLSDDIFVRDVAAGVTTRVSVASDGTQSDSDSDISSISADGRFVAFHSDGSNLVVSDLNGVDDVFVHDRLAGTTFLASVASGGAQQSGNTADAAISPDGRFVAFSGSAPDLVAGDTNGLMDIFVRDTQEDQTTRVSLDSFGGQGNGPSQRPAISEP